MDPGEQPAIAPFELLSAWSEEPAHRHAFRLEGEERSINVRSIDADRAREVGGGDRPSDSEPAAEELEESIFTRPGL